MKLSRTVFRAIRYGRNAILSEVAQTTIRTVGSAIVGSGTLVGVMPSFRNSAGNIWPLSGAALIAILLTAFLAASILVIAKLRVSGRRAEFREQWKLEQMQGRAPVMPEPLLDPAGTSQRNIYYASLRDPKFLAGAAGTTCLYIVAIFSVAAVANSSFAVSAVVRAKPGIETENAMVIVLGENGKTVSTGVLNADSVVTFAHPFEKGRYRILVCREHGELTQWSEGNQYLEKAFPKLEIVGFPQHSHPRVQIPAVHFELGSSEILPGSSEAVAAAFSQLVNHEGEVIIAGRTCDLPFAASAKLTNYELSGKRCEAVAEEIDRVVPRAQMIFAPLDHQFPLAPHATTEQMRARDRSVTIIPLLRIPYDASR